MGGEHHDLVTVAPLGQLLRDRRAHPVRRICGHSSVTGRHDRGRQVSQLALTASKAGSVLRAGCCPLIKHQHATGWEGGPHAAVRLSIWAAVRLSVRAAVGGQEGGLTPGRTQQRPGLTGTGVPQFAGGRIEPGHPGCRARAARSGGDIAEIRQRLSRPRISTQGAPEQPPQLRRGPGDGPEAVADGPRHEGNLPPRQLHGVDPGVPGTWALPGRQNRAASRTRGKTGRSAGIADPTAASVSAGSGEPAATTTPASASWPPVPRSGPARASPATATPPTDPSGWHSGMTDREKTAPSGSPGWPPEGVRHPTS